MMNNLVKGPTASKLLLVLANFQLSAVKVEDASFFKLHVHRRDPSYTARLLSCEYMRGVVFLDILNAAIRSCTSSCSRRHNQRLQQKEGLSVCRNELGF
jgi:hypothetical protein